jgi:hypothetical protein
VEKEPSTGSVQAMPLEAIWPVELRPTGQPPAQPGPASDAAAAPLVQRRSAEDVAGDDQVRSVLDSVKSGQRSDSSVELVLPRRPRPTSPAQLARMPETPTEESPPPVVPQTPPPAPRQAAPSPASPAAPEPSPAAPAVPPVQRQTETPPADAPLVQRQVETPAAPSGPSQYVQTDIGPLPGDLWNYLGVQPPGSDGQSTAAPAVQAAAAAPSSIQLAPVAPVMRATTPAAPPTNGQAAKPAPQISPQPLEGFISRVESAPEPAAESREPEGGAEGGPKVDVDELARQVYSELKRRLATEWERSRGRF